MSTTEARTRTLIATDLAGSEPHTPLWRTLRRASRVVSPTALGLGPTHASGLEPGAGGRVTAAGFGFTETSRTPPHADEKSHVVVVTDPSLLAPKKRRRSRSFTTAPPSPDQRHVARVALTAREVRGRAVAGEGLTLLIRGRHAQVGIDPGVWPAVAEPVLLAISLSWRFARIADQLDELFAWSRTACVPPGLHLPRRLPWRLPPGGELSARRAALRRLVLDLPCFEGPLIDPRGYFAAQRSARLFQALVERLGLDACRSLIDERIEIVEAVLEALAEDHRHSAALACEVTLEVLILAALLADIAINVSALFAGG